MTTEVPVIFSVNDQYVAPLMVAMTSLIDHVNDHDQYHLIVLNQGLTPQHQADLKALADYRVSVDLVSMGDQFDQLMAGDTGKLRGVQATLTMYFRLFIAEMFPEYEQVVYLDADTIIETDIAELYHLDLGDNLIAAASDTFAWQQSQTAAYIETVLGLPAMHYVNSGVLVMNLKEFRAQHFSERFIAAYQTTTVTPIAPDQDYLNALCVDKVKLLPITWNATPMESPLVEAPKLIHFCLFEKPWHYTDVAYADRFWHYAAFTPYEQDLKKQLAAYSVTDRDQDQHNAVKLVQQTVTVAKQGATLIPTVLLSQLK